LADHHYYETRPDHDLRTKRANLLDVARLAGVARSSASRALTGHPDVSPAMRQRVLAAAQQLGYEPDFLAQSLRSGQTLTVGFVVPDISNALVAEVTHGAETSLRAHGYTLAVLDSESNPELDVKHIRLLEHRRVDGALIAMADETYPPTLSAMRELSVPSVLIDRELSDESIKCSAVVADHERAVGDVVAHLDGLGHKTIGLVVGSQPIRPDRETARAFRLACSERGLDAVIDPGPFSPQHGLTATTKMLSSAVRPTAVISGSNGVFPGVLRAIRAHNLEIPRDLSLVAIDDLVMLDLFEPPIDVVKRPALACGRIAGELLLRRLAGEGPESVLLPSEFEPRGSSAPPLR
jgi:LacI family transcriptional regulator